MFEKIKTYFINRKIKALTIQGKKIPHDFISLSNAKSIGLLINVNQCNTEDLKDVHHYIDAFKAKGVTVVLFELNFIKKSIPGFKTSAHSVFINPEKINWLDFPNATAQSQIAQHKVDILINFDTSDKMTSHYICALANAKTRTGIHREGLESFYELMVSFKENRFKKMVPHFEHYLKMLEK
ncbi:MAG: hypothetical protein K1X92_02555 [Bacteroidia bacterium]|nr:hypothetical protein [Bacteroidia bacterium]